MANSFSAANAYNGQYAQPPFYPPYMQNSGQSNTGHAVIPPIPTPPFPPLSVNAQRYEANSHVSSPPLPGQLPRDWNPDVLRQLAASGSLRFPFPPPPPPPPPQLFSATFPPHQQPQNASAPPGPHQFQPFQSSNSQFLPATPTSGQPSKSLTEHGRHNDALHGKNGVNTSAIATPKTNAVSAVPTHTAHSLHGASFSRVAGTFSNAAKPLSNIATAPRVETISIPEGSVAPGMLDELHLRAKAAIKECIPMGADFDFWLQSGVDSSVLDGLFDELNIDRRSSGLHTAGAIVDTTNKPPSPSFEPSSQDVEQDSLPLSQTPQPEIADPQLERKDRIAKMLAAKSKKGQTLASAKSSQSGSPAPDRVTRPEVVQSKPIESQDRDKSKPESGQGDVVMKNVPEPLKIVDLASVPDLSAGLLTPAHEQSSSSAFAIPGLFMTSADEAEFEKQRDKERALTAETKSTEVQPAAPKSLKRSAEALSEDVLPQHKRQASYVVTTPAVPTAPASEIVTLSSPVLPADSTSGHSASVKPSVGDAEKLTDVNTYPVRSMVNQAALKDRMAALKAKMQMDKSRKQALQDGMPMLAAEVEKTRQSLEERHSKLAAIQKDIEVKDAELLRLRADENELVLEIRRLDSQLIDGENGQRQFSNELNQLDNQIQVNEKESANSPKFAPAEPVSITARPPSLNKPQSPSSATPQMIPTTTQITQSQAPVAPFQYENLRRSLTTEYNPEQADLDRQLESGLVPVTDDELLRPSDNESNHIVSSGSVGDVRGTEASTSVSVVDEQQSELDSEDDRMSIDEASDAGSSGSASMSDSGSEDYEPALNQHEIHPVAMEDNDDYEPADAYQPTTDVENDDYEPAEQVPIIDVDGLEEDASGYEGPSDKSTPTVDVPAPTTNGVVIESVTPISSSPLPPTSTTQTSPIVTSEEQKLTIPQQTKVADPFPLLAPLSDSEKPAVSRFVPYQSPLASFKSFRFHPQFSDVVKSGFRSLTYSNNIDPKTPICSNELEGRFCDDVNCVDQHFGSMALSDDKILVQMSSANDLKDKDQRDTYLLGLKKVIAGLREQGVREFSEVANALSKYRREWLQAQDGVVFT